METFTRYSAPQINPNDTSSPDQLQYSDLDPHSHRRRRHHHHHHHQHQHQHQHQHADWAGQQQLSLSSHGDGGLEESMWPRMNLQPQMEMWSSSVADDLLLYPERPGEPDCSYYMRTGSCGFGTNCKFNHSPARRMVKLGQPSIRSRGEYPERMDQPECQYYLKTGTCKFGASCKYDHPLDKAAIAGNSLQLNALNLPLREGEKECAYYMRTGNCKYGVTCKFNHPVLVVQQMGMGRGLVPLPHPMLLQNPAAAAAAASVPRSEIAPLPPPSALQVRSISTVPHIAYRQPGLSSLPAWPPPYSLMQAPTTFNNAGQSSFILSSPQGAWNPYQASIPGMIFQEGQQIFASSNYAYAAAAAAAVNPSVQDPVSTNLYPSFRPAGADHFTATIRQCTSSSSNTKVAESHGQNENMYPERPGEQECQYYMRRGECKYGARCKFHHPVRDQRN